MKVALHRKRGVKPVGAFALKPIACCVMLACGGGAYANPTGPQVMHGAAQIQGLGTNSLKVTNTPGSIIHWQGFSIGAGQTTQFIQQSASSSVLNRVVGADISQIHGQLLSNGRVFLINPAGILIGAGAVIDTAGFVGSTLNMLDGDFLAGKLKFQGGEGAGSIVNQGWIKAGAGGNIVLVAPNVENSGIIQTEGGEIVLAAGRKMTIGSMELEGVQFEIQAPTDSVLNVGKLLADGGAVGVFAGTLKHSGDIRANALARDEAGRIVLKGKEDVTLTAGSSVKADGKTGGAITVQSTSGTTIVSGDVSARGGAGRGGDVRVLGHRVGVQDNAAIDASGVTGGGQILVGGDYLGRNAEVQNAWRTFVGPDATLRADAIDSGAGGNVIVWSNDTTRFHGAISARGGAQSGDGGFVETSGKHTLIVGDSARVDARAPAGRNGTWLLDPDNININTGNLDPLSSADQFSDPGDANIAPGVIAGAGADVTLQANNDIEIFADVQPGAGFSLTMQAGRSIIFDDAVVTTTGGGNITLIANETTGAGVNGGARLAGAAVIDMGGNIAAINAGTGNVELRINPGTGHAGTSGNIILHNVTGQNVTIVNNGPTAGSGIERIDATSVITATNSITLSGATVGAAAAPMRLVPGNGNVIATSTGAGVNDGIFLQQPPSADLIISRYSLLAQPGTAVILSTGNGQITVDGSITLPGVNLSLLPSGTSEGVHFTAPATITAATLTTGGSGTENTTFVAGGNNVVDINATLTSTRPVLVTSGVANLNGAATHSLQQPVTINGGTINFNSATNIVAGAGNRLILTGGMLGGTALLTVNGDALWSGGGMSTSGGTTSITGALTMNTNDKTFSERTLTVGGATTWTAGNVGANGGIFNTDGAFNIQGDVLWTTNGAAGAFTTINNNAGLTRSTTAGIAALDRAILQGAGAITVNGGGTLRLSGDSVAGGQIVAPTGAIAVNAGTLQFAGGTYRPTGTITGAGTVSASGGTFEPQNATFTPGTFAVSGGTANLAVGTPNPGALAVSGGALNLTAATTVTNAVNVTGGTLTFSAAGSAGAGGSLTGTGTLSVANGQTFTVNGGTFDWQNGTISGPGTVTVGAGGTLAISQNNVHTLAGGAQLVNNGIVNWTGSGAIHGVSGANEIENNGTWNANNNSNMAAVAPGTLSFVNSLGANFVKGGGAGDIVGFDGVPFTQDGGTTVNAGTLNLIGGGTSAQPFTVNGGGTLQFGGGTFNVNNTITGAGNLTVSGGALNANGQVTTTGAFSVTGGAVTLNANGTSFAPSSVAVSGAGQATFNRRVENGGAFNLTGGVAEFNADSIIGAAASAISGGILRGTGVSTLNAALALTGGTIATTGAGALDVNGTTTVSAGNPQISGFLDTQIFNQTGGTLDILGTGTLFIADSVTSNVTAGTLNNAGILRVAGLAGLNFGGTSVLTNSGTLDAQTATIVYGGGTQTFNAGTAFNGIAGGNRVTTNAAFNGAITSQNLTLASGVFTGTAAVLNGPTAWEGGALMGAFEIPNAVTLSLNGAGQKTLDAATLTTSGTGQITVAGTGILVLTNGSALTIAANGTLELQTNANIEGGVGALSTLSNMGTLTKTTAVGTSTIGGATPLTFTNTNTLNAAAGTTLNYAATSTFNAGTQFTGAGAHTVNGNATFNGAVSSNNNLTLASGNFGGTPTLTGTTSWSGGQITGDFTIPAGSTLDLLTAGTKTVDGSTARITNNGTLTLNDGILSLLNGATIANNSIANWNGGAAGGITLDALSTFQNNAAGTVNLVATATNTGVTGAGTFQNLGIVNSNAPGIVTVISSTFTNGGTTNVDGGILALSGGGNHAGIFAIDAGTTLRFGGGAHTVTAAGQVNANGALEVTAGTLTSQGGITLSPNGSLTITNSTLSNNGTLSFNTGGNDLLVGAGGIFDNGAAGVLDIQGDLFARGAGTGVFNNAGTVRKSGGTVPGAGGFDATLPFNNNGGLIDSQVGAFQLIGGGTHTGQFRTAGNGVNLNGGVHTFAAGSSIVGPFVFLNGGATLTANGLTVNSALTWNGPGTINGTALNVAPGGTLNIGAAGDHVLDGNVVVNNQGTTNYDTPGNGLLINNGAAFNNLAGATFDFQGDLLVQTTAGAGAFSNTGTVLKSAGAGTGGFAATLPFTNHGGTLNVQMGTLEFAGVNTFNNGTQFIGVGNNLISNNTAFNGTITSNGLTLANGTFSGTANLAGTTTWTGGNITGNYTVPAGSTLNLTGAGNKTVTGVTLTNAGTTTLAGTGNLSLDAAGFANTGTLDIQSDADITQVSPSTLTNAGTLLKTAGTGTSAIGGPGFTMTSTGTLHVRSGTLQAQAFPTNAGTLTIDAGTTFSTNGNALANTGTLKGNGTLALGGAALTNSGTVAPGASPGALVIGGDFVQTPAGVLAIELGGLTQGVTYDFLQVTGNAALDGILNVTQFGAFVPSTGDRFEFMTYASRTGDFATLNFPVGSDLRAVPGATSYAILTGAPFNPAAAGTTIESTRETRRLYDDFLELTPQHEEEPEVRPRSAIICD